MGPGSREPIFPARRVGSQYARGLIFATFLLRALSSTLLARDNVKLLKYWEPRTVVPHAAAKLLAKMAWRLRMKLLNYWEPRTVFPHIGAKLPQPVASEDNPTP